MAAALRCRSETWRTIQYQWVVHGSFGDWGGSSAMTIGMITDNTLLNLRFLPWKATAAVRSFPSPK